MKMKQQNLKKLYYYIAQFLITLLVITSVVTVQPQLLQATVSQPSIELSDAELSPGETGVVTITGRNIPDPGLAGYRLNVVYDPLQLEVTGLEMTANDPFSIQVPNFALPGTAIIAGIQPSGVKGTIVLTRLRIKVKDTATGTTNLRLEIKELSSKDLKPLTAQAKNGQVVISTLGTGQPQPALPLSMNLSALPIAIIGQAYQHTLTANDGNPPYSWLASGLPEGLNYNSATGQITGIPTAKAESNLVEASVTDNSAPRQTVSAQLVLEVKSTSSGSRPGSGSVTPPVTPPVKPPISVPVPNVENKTSSQVVHAGLDRYQTALKIALAHFNQPGPKNVVIANGYAPADALAGAPLAYKLKAPIMLSTLQSSGSTTVNDFLSLTQGDGGQVVLLGSTGVLDPSYNSAFPSMEQQRLGGANRRETAIQIAKTLLGDTTGTPVVIVNENAFVDAISVAPFAAQEGWPILLTQGDQLSKETAAYLDQQKPSSILIIGSTGVVSDKTRIALQTKTNPAAVTRLGGSNRFETNSQVLNWAKKQHPERFTKEGGLQIAFANGDANDVIDALAGAALGIPIILVHNKRQFSASQTKFLSEIGEVPSQIFGSSGVIDQTIAWN